MTRDDLTGDDSAITDLTRDGGYLEYSKASNPLASGAIPAIPIIQFPASIHASGPSQILPLDIRDRKSVV